MERDWRIGHRDIDIIAIFCDTLVFVEVKTRAPHPHVKPEDAVGTKKIYSLRLAAHAFLKMKRTSPEIRFDVITVTGTMGGEYEINHIENAFPPH